MTTTEPARLGEVAATRGRAARTDIQILRAFAVLSVVLFHLWPNRLRGGYVGVDVFFVISGFLITSHLLSHPPARARDVAEFWGRRARRLLPAACLVILATTAVAWFVLPPSALRAAGREALAATFYVENWLLAAQATDYLAAEASASPFQHYWSLSVEEQFYLLWPLLVGLLVAGSHRLRRSSLTVVAIGVSTVLVASIAYSAALTTADPPRAYFVTPTRLWELCLGGLIAALPALSRALPASLRAATAWLGLGIIVAACVVYSSSTSFPGTAALVPTVGAALVIVARSDSSAGSPSRLLPRSPLVALGDISYSVYLWHWPLIVLGPHLLGRHLAWTDKIALVLVTLVLAAGTKRYVEDAFRYPSSRRPIASAAALAAICMAVAASAAVAASTHADRVAAREQATAEHARLTAGDECFGAAAARDRACGLVGEVLLQATGAAARDKPEVYRDDCWSGRPFTRHAVCTYGSDSPARTIALVGNSHAGHWQPALVDLVRREGWQLTTYLVSECYTVDVRVQFSTDQLMDGCERWNDWARTTIEAHAPDLVVMSDRTNQPLDGVDATRKTEVAQAAYARVIDGFVARGSRVLVLRDTPAASENAPDCVARHLPDLDACTTPADVAIEADPLAAAAESDTSGRVAVLDVNDLLCRSGACHSVVGGLVVYFDHGHLTSTFATTLRPEVEAAVRSALSR